MRCIFCSIVQGQSPAWVVYDDEHCLAFLDVFPATKGHVLVIPKRHADDLLVMDEDDAAAVMRATHRVAAMLDNALQPAGLNVLQANRAAAWQSVFHMHVHVIPRYEDDGLRHTWDAKPAAAEALTSLHEELMAES